MPLPIMIIVFDKEIKLLNIIKSILIFQSPVRNISRTVFINKITRTNIRCVANTGGLSFSPDMSILTHILSKLTIRS